MCHKTPKDQQIRLLRRKKIKPAGLVKPTKRRNPVPGGRISSCFHGSLAGHGN